MKRWHPFRQLFALLEHVALMVSACSVDLTVQHVPAAKPTDFELAAVALDPVASAVLLDVRRTFRALLGILSQPSDVAPLSGRFHLERLHVSA